MNFFTLLMSALSLQIDSTKMKHFCDDLILNVLLPNYTILSIINKISVKYLDPVNFRCNKHELIRCYKRFLKDSDYQAHFTVVSVYHHSLISLNIFLGTLFLALGCFRLDYPPLHE